MTYADLLDALIRRDPVVQSVVGAVPDGVWGPRTERALEARLHVEWERVCEAHGWVFLPAGAHRTRTEPIAQSILHWPGSTRTARKLGSSWRRNESGSRVSSHCGIDENEVIWYRPPHTVTHHAGIANGASIGIDICAPILGEHEDNARKRGIFVGRRRERFSAPNGGTHGGDLLDLHPAIAMRVAAVRRALDTLGISPVWTDHAAVDPDRKWDCRPWRPVLRRVGALDSPELV